MYKIYYECICAFIAGLLVDGTAVFWTHHSEKGNAKTTGLIGCIQATTLVTGLGESIHDWHTGPFFVIGYGLGSFLMVSLKNRINK